MISVSSSCVNVETIRESVEILAKAGYRNIELSSGTKFYTDYEKDLLDLQEIYGLNYLVHNYFPPPPKPFVLNLASLDDEIFAQSIHHCKRSIALSKRIDSNRYSVHAGFLVDIRLNQIGKKIAYGKLFDKKKALARFKDAWVELQREASDNLTLYIENNVFSYTNKHTYKGTNPFLFADLDGYLELSALIQFKPLVDLAHLKVSANSLGLDFKEQAKELLPLTDYIHISDNDGLHDQNKGMTMGSDILKVIERDNFSPKAVTLEINEGFERLREGCELLKRHLSRVNH